MEHYKAFSISGLDKELLEKALTLNKDLIEDFNKINCFYVDERGILVLCYAHKDTMEKDGYTPYPFTVTVGMLAEHIMTAISEVSEEQLELLGEAENGYEESVEYGWRLFKPVGTYYKNDTPKENRDRVSKYSWCDVVLAAQPIKIEYGK